MKKIILISLSVLAVALAGCQLRNRQQANQTNPASPFPAPYGNSAPGANLPGDPMSDFLTRQNNQNPAQGLWSNNFGNIPQPAMQQPPVSSMQPPTVSSPPAQQNLSNVPVHTNQLVPVTPITSNPSTTSLASTASNSPVPQHLSMTYPSPEYGILKLDKIIPQEVNLKQRFKYTIILTNLTNAQLSDLVVTETLSHAFQFSAAQPQPRVVQGKLLWKIDTLGPKSSTRIGIIGTPTNLEALKNNTSVTYSIETSSTIPVVQPSLALVRNVPAEVLICDPIPIQYVVKNTGSGEARNVRILETLPNGVKTADGQQNVAIDVGTLQSGEARTFTTQLHAAQTGSFSNQARAVSSSGIEATSARSVTRVRAPSLNIVKNVASRYYLGRPLNYSITVENHGDGEAREVALDETLPSGVSQVKASAGADITGTKLTWQLGTIAPNTSKTVQVSYRCSNVGSINSTTTASAPCCRTVSKTSSIQIVGVPDVSLSVNQVGNPVSVGGTVTYIITASNQGTAPDSNLRIACNLENPLDYVSASGPTQASVMGRTVTFQRLRTLNPGDKATWRLVAKAVKSGQVRFKVSLTSDGLTRPVENTVATFIP